MSNDHTYEVFSTDHGAPIKAWTRGVPVEEEAKKQLFNISTLPFIYRWIAVMPDVHLGKGATVGSVIPTTKAIIPGATCTPNATTTAARMVVAHGRSARRRS